MTRTADEMLRLARIVYPDTEDDDYRALTHKLAQVIEKEENTGRNRNGRVKYAHTLWRRFGKALATNDTTALEALLAELMGWEG